MSHNCKKKNGHQGCVACYALGEEAGIILGKYYERKTAVIRLLETMLYENSKQGWHNEDFALYEAIDLLKGEKID
jgi:hypothetical protein